MPYLILGAVGVVMAVVAWWRAPSAERPWAFLTTAGAITLGDLFSTGIFAMYQYKPGLLPNLRDNYLGVLLAECLFVPAYYAFLSILSWRYRYWVYCLSVLPIVVMEILFLRLGIYFHRTWTLWHSVIAFLLYSLAAAYLAGAFRRNGYSGIRRLILIASIVYYAMNLWGLIPMGILRLARFHLHLVASDELDMVLSSLLLHAVPFTLVGIIGTWFRWTRRPSVLVSIALGFAMWLFLLRYLGIWKGRPPWNPWLSGLATSLVMAAIAWVDHWFSAHVPDRVQTGEPADTAKQ